jgi:hypothetical protein
MADQVEEKGNMNKILAGIMILTVIGVVLLKSRETEHLESGASTASTQQAFEAANVKRKAGQNNFY